MSALSNGKVYLSVAATNDPVQRDAIGSGTNKRSLTSIRHSTRQGQSDAAINHFVAASYHSDHELAERGFLDSLKKVGNSIGNAVGGAVDKIGGVFSGGAEKAKEFGNGQ